MSKKLYILHKYGDPRHFLALYYYCKKNNIELQFSEYNFFVQFYRVIKRIGNIHKLINNLKIFFNFILTSNKNIIIGAPPYTPIVFILNILKKRHNIIY
ncbi:MAG: hypothetical protein ACP6IY_20735, partial [Promethearchaeia archaeon]